MLATARTHVAHGGTALGLLVRADDHGHGSRRSGRPASSAPSSSGRRTPGPRRGRLDGAGRRASPRCRRRRCPPRTPAPAREASPKTPSASQASRMRSTPRAKPIPGVGGPPKILHQTVVAAAPAHRVLGGVERLGRELEGGAAVVVEAAYEPGRHLVMPASRLSRPALTAAKWSAEAPDRKSAIDGASAITFWSSARLESSTRSGLRSSVDPGLLGQVAPPILQVRAERSLICGAALGVPETVDLKAHAPQPESRVEADAEADHLHVGVRDRPCPGSPRPPG